MNSTKIFKMKNVHFNQVHIWFKAKNVTHLLCTILELTHPKTPHSAPSLHPNGW